MSITSKICSKCKEEKTFENFYPCKYSKYERRSICIKCDLKRGKEWFRNNPKSKEDIRNHNLKMSYGIDISEYNKMFLEQEGKCAICKTHQSELKRNLSIDHCHNANEIRLLLCNNCNTGLGLFKDNPIILADAIKYLLLHKNKPKPKSK